MELKDQLYAMNSHWENKRYVYPFQRFQLPKIISSLDKKMIITLIGPRRVGKTILLRQTISYLIDSKFEKNRLVYFSFDDFEGEPHQVLKQWAEIFGVVLNEGRIFVFFDEIQKVENWASKIKILYDNFPNLTIVISGSSSAELNRGKESLAGREIRFDVEPLSFEEYLKIKNIDLISDDLRWDHYLNYMKRQLPALAFSDIDPNDYIKEVVDKTIEFDIPNLLKIQDPSSVRSIFRIICKSPGQIIRLEDIASELGINRITASKYLHALEQSLLVRKLYNYSSNARKSEKRSKKYYPYYSSLHLFVAPFIPELPQLAETEVAFQTKAQYFWNDRGHEIDFIVGPEVDIGIEVKIRNRIDKSDVIWLLNSPFKLSRRFVVVNKESKVDIPKEVQSIIIPNISSAML